MKTPGHAVINLAVLGTALDPALAAPILLGAIVPDVPIMLLYLRERIWRKTPEETIWRDHYQRPFWQNLIHGMHSIPLSAIGALGSWALGLPALAVMFGSMLFHALGDLPVHAIDAHRHFLPFSQYRFISPISYWDPNYHGAKVALVEIALVFASSAVIATWDIGQEAWLLAAVDLFYVVSYWRDFRRR